MHWAEHQPWRDAHGCQETFMQERPNEGRQVPQGAQAREGWREKVQSRQGEIAQAQDVQEERPLAFR